MARSILIGDETTAAGFRLAGLDVVVPAKGKAGEALSAALQDADLILITAGLAREVPAGMRDEALRGKTPMVVIVPDINASVAPPNMEANIRQILGIEA
jgi:vacuolar-type H+-ATPase subunit F/Vma7